MVCSESSQIWGNVNPYQAKGQVNALSFTRSSLQDVLFLTRWGFHPLDVCFNVKLWPHLHYKRRATVRQSHQQRESNLDVQLLVISKKHFSHVLGRSRRIYYCISTPHLGRAAVPIRPGLQGVLQAVRWTWPAGGAVEHHGRTHPMGRRGDDWSAEERIHLRVQSPTLLWWIPGGWQWGEGGQDIGRRWMETFVLQYEMFLEIAEKNWMILLQ